MAKEDDTSTTEDGRYLLPRYLRFARTLALVSGATIGIAAGVSVISGSGCSSSCNGICGDVMGLRVGAGGAGGFVSTMGIGGFVGTTGIGGFVGTTGIGGFVGTTGIGGASGLMGIRPPDSGTSDVGPGTDAGGDAGAIVDGGNGDADDTGGGPRPAPLLPCAWIG